jgi:hypothetical protein
MSTHPGLHTGTPLQSKPPTLSYSALHPPCRTRLLRHFDQKRLSINRNTRVPPIRGLVGVKPPAGTADRGGRASHRGVRKEVPGNTGVPFPEMVSYIGRARVP